MSKLILRITASIILLLALSSCTSCSDKPEACDLVVLYTTDIHGNVLPYDFNKNEENEVSLANASTLIKQLSKEYQKNLLLLDGGDLFQGTPAMYYYNYYNTEQYHLISRILNYLKYSAVVAGNHDLESGGDRVDTINKEMKMPRLGSNIIDTRKNRVRYRPYKIFERGGFKIAVMGLITPETENQIPRSLIPYMSFQTMVTNAKKWMKEIKENEQPDYTICVLHAGIKDIEIVTANQDTIHDGLSYVVNNVPGIDLLLFGHDHGVYNGEMVNPWGDTVKVLQSAAHAAEIGRIDIRLSRDEDDNVIKQTTCQRLNLKDYPVDEEYVSLFSGAIDTVNDFLDNPLGYIDEDLDMVGTLYKQTNTMDLIHSVQLDATNADVSFCCALSTFNDMPAGPITYRTIFSIYKYDNQLHKMWMKGEEIKKFLEYGYDRQFGTMTSEDSHLLAFQYDNKGKIIYARFGPELITPQYNFTSAAGINYEVDVRKPFGERVNIISMADGSRFEPTRQYTVAMSSYQAAGGGGFVSRGLGWTKDDIAYHTLSISSKTISKIIVEYMRAGKHHESRENVGTWKVVPEEWAKRVGQKDALLLIPYLKK